MSRTTDKPLSYLMLFTGHGLGGLELQMIARHEDAMLRGDNSFLVYSSRGRLWKQYQAQGFQQETIEFNIPYYDVFATFKLARIIRKYKIDVCVVGESRLLSQVLIARKIWQLPTAIVFYRQMQSGISKRDWFHNRIYSQLDAVITSTEAMKREMLATTVIDADRVHVVPYGVRSNIIKPLPDSLGVKSQFGIPDDAFVVGCIGRFDPQKDQSTLIEAFAAAKLPPNSILVLAGDPTPGYAGYAEELGRKVTELGIASRVIFLPFTQHVSRLFPCFDIFVMPSRSETFGLVVIEAMASGIPVIATEAGGVPEIIENGRTGLLFQPGDKEALSGHLEQLAASQNLREQYSTQGRQTALERFDYKRQSEKFFDVCREAYFSRED